MAWSIHLICRYTDTGLRGLTLVEKPSLFRSEAWELTTAEADILVGGWVYLHPTKAEGSAFGGKVMRVADAGSVTAHGRPEIALFIESSVKGKGQKWRGANYGMAWSGGVVKGDLPHEIEISGG
jgi:hypothetical protein